MRFAIPVIIAFVASCSSEQQVCNVDCARFGFTVLVPSGALDLKVTGCSAAPEAAPRAGTNEWFVEVSGGSTCHVDLTVSDGSHRSGDSAITYHDQHCCPHYTGQQLDLSH